MPPGRRLAINLTRVWGQGRKGTLGDDDSRLFTNIAGGKAEVGDRGVNTKSEVRQLSLKRVCFEEHAPKTSSG